MPESILARHSVVLCVAVYTTVAIRMNLPDRLRMADWSAGAKSPGFLITNLLPDGVMHTTETTRPVDARYTAVSRGAFPFLTNRRVVEQPKL